MAQSHTLMTAEQLMELAGDRRVELVRGELVEMSPVGLTHVRLVGVLMAWLAPFVIERKLGLLGPELGCILSRDPDIVRAPDIAFISLFEVFSCRSQDDEPPLRHCLQQFLPNFFQGLSRVAAVQVRLSGSVTFRRFLWTQGDVIVLDVAQKHQESAGCEEFTFRQFLHEGMVALLHTLSGFEYRPCRGPLLRQRAFFLGVRVPLWFL